MVVPFRIQNLASHVSLPSCDCRPSLKSKVSIYSIASSMHKKKSPHQDIPTHPQSYTKAYGPCTLSLNTDCDADSGLPIFSNGMVLSGSLEISKISKTLQSIQIMVVTGRVLVQADLGTAGPAETILFSHVFYDWSREYNPSPPPVLIPLSYPLPSKYIDHITGLEHQVPPTHKARLYSPVPGLRVKVQYDLSAKIVRSRRRIPFMTNTTMLHVPFIYQQKQQFFERVALPSNPRFRPGTSQSRPGSAHSAHKGHGGGKAQKVFVCTTPSPFGERETEIRVYLPHGQVCALDEPMPFVIKVFAADRVLEELHSSVPPVTNPKDDFASFHPIGPDPPKIRRPRTSSGKIKVKVELVRTTKVDVKYTQFVDATRLGFLEGAQMLSEGVIERMTRGSDWVAWSGMIIVPDDVKCGGFASSRVEVFDQLVLSIRPTSSSRSPVISFSDGVPVRLTPRISPTSNGSTLMMKQKKSMSHYPPPQTSSSGTSGTSWVSSDGNHP